MKVPWRFTPVTSLAAGRAVVERIARAIRDKGLIPPQEFHDSLIVAESALYPATLLVSSDSHIKDIDQTMLKITLDACGVACPLIASPRKIVREFFR